MLTGVLHFDYQGGPAFPPNYGPRLNQPAGWSGKVPDDAFNRVFGSVGNGHQAIHIETIEPLVFQRASRYLGFQKSGRKQQTVSRDQQVAAHRMPKPSPPLLFAFTDLAIIRPYPAHTAVSLVIGQTEDYLRIHFKGSCTKGPIERIGAGFLKTDRGYRH